MAARFAIPESSAPIDHRLGGVERGDLPHLEKGHRVRGAIGDLAYFGTKLQEKGSLLSLDHERVLPPVDAVTSLVTRKLPIGSLKDLLTFVTGAMEYWIVSPK